MVRVKSRENPEVTEILEKRSSGLSLRRKEQTKYRDMSQAASTSRFEAAEGTTVMEMITE